MSLYGSIYYRRFECRGIDEPYRIPHLPTRGRGAARAARPRPQSAVSGLPGLGRPPHRLRAGAAHRRDLPRGDLSGLPPASPKLGGLLLLSMAAIALIGHVLIGLPWAAAFVLGAILAPTDPVAAEAIFRRLGVP